MRVGCAESRLRVAFCATTHVGDPPPYRGRGEWACMFAMRIVSYSRVTWECRLLTAVAWDVWTGDGQHIALGSEANPMVTG